MQSASSPGTAKTGAWYKALNGYHWWVLIVASFGWMFDTMNQRIFVLSRGPAMRDLLPAGMSGADITHYSGIVRKSRRGSL